MSASDVRRGPGWWMDLEGGWNPPETWPEPSPPLPGWIRSVDGRWVPRDGEAEAAAAAEDDGAGIEDAEQRSDDSSDDRPRLKLTYAERPAQAPVVHPDLGPSVRSAVLAALAAAVIAAMIATGMIVLVSLL